MSFNVVKTEGFLEDAHFQQARMSIGVKEGDRCALDDLIKGGALDSVFFHPDRFEVVVDAREYVENEVKVDVTTGKIEVNAKADVDMPLGDKQRKRHKTMTRTYELPQQVVPGEGNCYLSKEGILVIEVPWSK